MNLEAQNVIRVCIECKHIYISKMKENINIETCKLCDKGVTGFFKDFKHFIQYIDNYGVDTENIIDDNLKVAVCNHFQ